METKQRHGCVTAWLIMLIVVNSLTTLFYLLAGDTVSNLFPARNSDLLIILLGVMGLLNVLFAIMLMRWKKAGFFGFVASSVVVMIINMNIGLGIAQSLLGLIGIGVLYAIFQIKRDGISAWENLE